MNICPVCNTKTKSPFCSHCGTATEPMPKRLRGITVSGILCALIVAAFLVFLPIAVVEEFVRPAGASILHRLTCGLAGGACTLILGLWLWGLVRWTVFSVPRTFRAAKSVLSSIIPLGFLVLVAEVMFGIWLTLLPMAVYGMTAPAVVGLVTFLREGDFSLVMALLLFVCSATGFLYVAHRETGPLLECFSRKPAEQAVHS